MTSLEIFFILINSRLAIEQLHPHNPHSEIRNTDLKATFICHLLAVVRLGAMFAALKFRFSTSTLYLLPALRSLKGEEGFSDVCPLSSAP